jgi:hypothetical protein
MAEEQFKDDKNAPKTGAKVVPESALIGSQHPPLAKNARSGAPLEYPGVDFVRPSIPYNKN